MVRDAIEYEVLNFVQEWLCVKAAKGETPSGDTVKAYSSSVNEWLTWCVNHGIDPATAKEEDVINFCLSLTRIGAKQATVSLKLTAIRRFYDVKIKMGQMLKNPGIDVKIKVDWQLPHEKKYLSATDVDLLFRSICGNDIRSRRDRAIMALIVMEGLRRAEIVQLNMTDIEDLYSCNCRILIRCKDSGTYIHPNAEAIDTIRKYLAMRGTVDSDAAGVPVFVAISKGGSASRRLSKIGINWIIDSYLRKIGVKQEGISCQTLRYTCGHLMYENTKDAKAVQIALRYASLASTEELIQN